MSNKIMSILSSCPVDLGVMVGLNQVCIDNKEIRNQIAKANKIEITTVPCILIVYKEGVVEKYEGEKAFEWIGEIIKKVTPPPVTPPKTPPIQRIKKKIVEESESEPELEPESPKPQKSKSKSRRSKKETTMEELGIEDSEFINEKTEQKAPPNQAAIKAKDLMATAMAMQKERDTVDGGKSKPNGDIITNKRPF